MLSRPGRVLDVVPEVYTGNPQPQISTEARPWNFLGELIPYGGRSNIGAMPSYTADPVVAGPGWAIRRVGPCVLGYWAAPMTEERINACAALYRTAHAAHGRFSVFAVFTTTPFHLETLLETRARNAIVSLVNEFAAHFTAVTCVFEMPRGFRSSIARTSAAAVTRVTSRNIPFIFADSRKEAYSLARARGSLDVVDQDAHEREIGELKKSAETA